MLIHSTDPNRKTDTDLLATAYFYHDLRLMEQYAKMLGNHLEAEDFAREAKSIAKAFNEKFFEKELGQYDNGTQTSCVLPLAFGLAPAEQRSRVFDHLIKKISIESHNHIGTGLIGGQYLNRTLSDFGRADVAYAIASQRDYPSWGYMLDKGATTIWELWNGDTADPAMNSGNHVMLVGDLVIWFYECLAGIKSDSAHPGFKHIIMNPQPVEDLQFVRGSHYSPHGLIVSEWHRSANKFDWQIEIPANATATIHVPAADIEQIKEGQRTVRDRPGIKVVGSSANRVVMEIGSGRYHFQVGR